MKVVFFILTISIAFDSNSQPNKLNKLFQEWSISFWSSTANPPFVNVNTKQLVVPHINSLELLHTMEWKNIDSIKMYDTAGPMTDVTIFGKANQYHLCEPNENCSVKYFNSYYKFDSSVESITILLTNENDEKSLTRKIRKHFRLAFSRLNKTPVIEDYRVSNYTPNTFLPPSKGIIVYLPGHMGEVYIPAKEIQEAKSLMPVLSTYKIVSFVYYITAAGLHDPPIIFNEGENFNDNLIRLLKHVRPGALMVFDQIKVLDGEGKIQTATPFVIGAK